ncbi:SEL1-like repeat protein, partial [Aeromonas allosaccharophila]
WSDGHFKCGQRVRGEGAIHLFAPSLGDIDSLQRNNKVDLAQLEQLAETLNGVQLRFFIQLKQIGDGVGIPLPEPDTLNLLEFGSIDIIHRLNELKEQFEIVPVTFESEFLALLNQAKEFIELDMAALDKRYRVAQGNEVVRCHYAALLLMALSHKDAISKPQQIILDLWLPAIGLEGRQSELMILASQLEKESLFEAIALIKQDKKLTQSLLLNIIILIRIGGLLDKESIALIELLVGFFSLDKQKTNATLCLAALMLDFPVVILDEPQLKKNHLTTYQYELGRIYYDGDVIPSNKEKAMFWFLKAAELKWSFLADAEQGHAESQCYIGKMYLYGQGVGKNPEKALYWYMKAATQGLAEAMCEIANMYLGYSGLDADPAQEIAWYRKAAEQGYAKGQFKLAECFERMIFVATLTELRTDKYRDMLENSLYWNRRAAEQGHAEAQYKYGVKLLSENSDNAMYWLLEAAKQGNAKAQEQIGEMYYEGRHVMQDYKQAYAWCSASLSNMPYSAFSWRDQASQKLTEAERTEAEQIATQYKKYRGVGFWDNV